MENFINLDNLRIHYNYVTSKAKVTGNPERPTIFMAHGWGGSSKSLLGLAEILNSKYDSYIIDLPGFGMSDNPPADWGTVEYAQLVGKWIKQVSKEQKIDFANAVYFGHSFGGGIGVYLAAEFSDLFSLLILSGSAVYRSPKVHPLVAVLKKIPFYENLKLAPRKFKRGISKLMGVSSDSHKFEKLESNFRKVIAFDLSVFAKAVKKPTLILWGNDDKDTPISQAYRLAEDIADETLKIYPSVGHGLPKLYPELISKDIDNFISTRI